MSQITKRLTSSGPIPPIIPTSFQTDLLEDVGAFAAGAGSAVPVANNLQVYGDTGIETVTNSASTDVVIIRYSKRFATTTNVQDQDLLTIPVATNKVETIHILVNGFANKTLDDTKHVIGGWGVTTVKNVAGVLTVIDTNDFVLDYDSELATAVVQMVTSGTNIVLRVTGVAGFTIEWGGLLPGRLQSPD